MTRLYLRDELAAVWAKRDPFESAAQLEGRVYRQTRTRRTLRVRVGARDYFAKIHEGVGWRELLKNWLSLKPAVADAGPEYRALQLLAAAAVPAPAVAAFGVRGRHPARRWSFLLLDPMDGWISLEDLQRRWQRQPPDAVLPLRLAAAAGRLVARLHGLGLQHRDLYLCHVLVERLSLERGRPRLGVLDLHRARRRSTAVTAAALPDGWRRRDLAALCFSARALAIEAAAQRAFLRAYEAATHELARAGTPLRLSAPGSRRRRRRRWTAVVRRARKLADRDARRQPERRLPVSRLAERPAVAGHAAAAGSAAGRDADDRRR